MNGRDGAPAGVPEGRCEVESVICVSYQTDRLGARGSPFWSDFESVGPDRPTRHAERGEQILGRNDCFWRFQTVSDGLRRFQTVFDQNYPTDRPTSEKG
jgi:hypothetical protein